MQQMPRSRDMVPAGRNTDTLIGDRLFAGLVRLSGWLMLALLGGLIAVLAWGGLSAWSAFGPGFVWSTAWNPVTQHFGAAAPVFGSVMTTLLALVFAVPLAFGIAFWLVEMAP
ncbi:hypothetical protein C7453_102625, partial [Gluconacetobacter liquefaciens]